MRSTDQQTSGPAETPAEGPQKADAEVPAEHEVPDELPLAAEFDAATRDQWRELVAGVLRKAGREQLPDPVEDALRQPVATGVSVAPLYTAEDAGDLSTGAGVPGLAPFVRGARAGDGEGVPAGWDVRQRHAHPDVAVTREAIAADLENGVTSLWPTSTSTWRRSPSRAGCRPPRRSWSSSRDARISRPAARSAWTRWACRPRRGSGRTSPGSPTWPGAPPRTRACARSWSTPRSSTTPAPARSRSSAAPSPRGWPICGLSPTAARPGASTSIRPSRRWSSATRRAPTSSRPSRGCARPGGCGTASARSVGRPPTRVPSASTPSRRR